MALDETGKLIEGVSSSGRPYVAIEKEINGRRTILIDEDGNLYSLDAKIKASFSDNVTTVQTFNEPMKGVNISNDGAEALVLTVNSIDITVDVGEVFDGRFDPFTSLTVTGNTAYRGTVTD